MKIAILYQATPTPEVDGVQKPFKQSGYMDSGADIAYALRAAGKEMITPVANPKAVEDADWVFADTLEGIEAAVKAGADTLWLNTVLYAEHPIQQFRGKGLFVVGQQPEAVEKYDDKLHTNALLREQGLAVIDSHIIAGDALDAIDREKFPAVVKPIRGRGSQGVQVVEDAVALQTVVKQLIDSQKYGSALMLENFLEGSEITITLMPAGSYQIGDDTKTYTRPWVLPPLVRRGHVAGVLPYSGEVAVVENSEILTRDEREAREVKFACRQSERAAQFLNIKAPIRIDCRSDRNGDFFMFDINMKPNLTGAGRPGRENQESLCAMSARALEWSYPQFVVSIANQRWEF